MSRRLQLAPPANWQDFEDLCLALWRRVWNDPNAQKHGRSGQRQAGVDIFGRPNDRTQWAGIQCKVVDGTLTARQIRDEVEKAGYFQPQLSHFVIATTARRDAAVQAAVRTTSDESLGAGGFSVNVVCWDDIVELLYENPDVISVFYPIERSQVEQELARPGKQSVLTVDDATVESISSLTKHEAEARQEWLANVARNHESSAVRRSALVALRTAESSLLRPISLIILDTEMNQNLRETAIKNLGVCGTEDDLKLLEHLEGTETISKFGKQAATKALAALSRRLQSPSVSRPHSVAPLFDVALSFAGEDRDRAHAIALALQQRAIRVFYDRFYEADLAGEDLSKLLGKIYSEASLFCLVLISQHYASKRWTSFELSHAQERAITDGTAYIIPVRVDDTKVQSVSAVTGYLDLRSQSIEQICDIVAAKVENARGRGPSLAEQLGLRKQG